MRLTALLVGAAIAVATVNAGASFQNGNWLLSRLQEYGRPESVKRTLSEAFLEGQASGYIQGAFDMGAGAFFCPPNSVNVRQILDMVRQFLESNPARRHEPADVLVIDAMKTAFPCKN